MVVAGDGGGAVGGFRCTCADAQPGRAAGRGWLVEDGWTCEPFLQGAAFDPEGVVGLGPAIDRFHEASAHLPQRPGCLSLQDLLAANEGGDVDLSTMPGEVVQACRAARAALGDGPEGVIHGDLSAANLLVSGCDGHPILLDWDESRRDLQSCDLTALGGGTEAERQAALAWEIACCWQVEPQRAQELGRRLIQR